VAQGNSFKAALRANRVQLGLWLSLADSYAADICAGSGADWLLIDAEHAPNDIRSITAQLQAIGSRAHPIVRPPIGEAWMIKQILDAGAQTLMIPMVETAEQAEALVAAMRYPPRGVRGVASSLARASNFGRDKTYLQTADDTVCLIVMIESRRGMANCESILSVDGVDGAFFGAADLAADMGHIGQADHEAVIAAIDSGIGAARRLGKGAGAFATPKTVSHLLDLGASFLSIAADISILASGADAKVRSMSEFRQPRA
jgi:4-hydroxy-2-oxoheptanedioate aldolase